MDHWRQELQAYRSELEAGSRKQRDLRRQLDEALDRTADLFDLSPVAMCTFDIRGTVMEANLAAATLFGVDRAHLEGQLLSRSVSLSDKALFASQVQRCIAHEQLRSFEVR